MRYRRVIHGMKRKSNELAPLIEAQQQDLARGNKVWQRHYTLLEHDAATETPPDETLSPELEALVTERAKVQASKLISEFIARFVAQLLKARNPKLQLIAWLYSSNFPVADILGCKGNTLREIAAHCGVTHQTLHKIVLSLGKQFQMSYSGQRLHRHD